MTRAFGSVPGRRGKADARIAPVRGKNASFADAAAEVRIHNALFGEGHGVIFRKVEASRHGLSCMACSPPEKRMQSVLCRINFPCARLLVHFGVDIFASRRIRKLPVTLSGKRHHRERNGIFCGFVDAFSFFLPPFQRFSPVISSLSVDPEIHD